MVRSRFLLGLRRVRQLWRSDLVANLFFCGFDASSEFREALFYSSCGFDDFLFEICVWCCWGIYEVDC